MRIMVADTTDPNLRKLIDAAAREPVTVLEDGKPAAVVLSPADFERLDRHERIRREAQQRLLEKMAKMQKKAAERGLTDAELERLLADES